MDQICEGEEIVNFKNYGDPTYKYKTDPETLQKTQEQEQEDTPGLDPSTAPNVVGKTITEARQILSQYSLMIYYVTSPTVKSGIVISQSVENGRVALRVSRGRT